MSPPEIVVTGIGIVSPAGISAEATWSTLLAGGRCIRSIDNSAFGLEGPMCCGLVPGFQLWAGGADRFNAFASAAATEALNQAGLNGDNFNKHRIALSFGFSKPPNDLPDCKEFNRVSKSISQFISATTYSHINLLRSLTTWHLGQSFHLIHQSVAACATGVHAVIRGCDLIRDGDADIVLCGSADASISPLWMASYRQMGVLAAPHPDMGFEYACRPFDQSRNGFAVGEGAGFLVVESAKSAARRGVHALVRMAGWARGNDPAGMTQLTEDGSPLERVIRQVIGMSCLEPSEITCIQAHGTATSSNDRIEARALQNALGDRARKVPTVSIKGAIGHLLGAAGSVELAVACLACSRGRTPGNVTLLERDAEFEGLWLPRETTNLDPGSILKTSLGFGGHLGAIIMAPS